MTSSNCCSFILRRVESFVTPAQLTRMEGTTEAFEICSRREEMEAVCKREPSPVRSFLVYQITNSHCEPILSSDSEDISPPDNIKRQERLFLPGPHRTQRPREILQERDSIYRRSRNWEIERTFGQTLHGLLCCFQTPIDYEHSRSMISELLRDRSTDTRATTCKRVFQISEEWELPSKKIVQNHTHLSL